MSITKFKNRVTHTPLDQRTGTYKVSSAHGNTLEINRFSDNMKIEKVIKVQTKMSEASGKKYFVDILFDDENYKGLNK